MPDNERQNEVLSILQNLRGLDGLKKLFWQELNYERENRPLSPRQWPESARQPLAEDPILFASGGEDNAFHVVYCRLDSDALLRGHERPIVNRLTREHPYALFVFSNKTRSDWHFLNVKYDEDAEKRRLFRRITVRPGEGLRTAAERLQMLDLVHRAGKVDGAVSPLVIQSAHDDAFDVEKVTKDFYREIANWYFWALKHVKFPKDSPKEKDGRDHISVIRLITRLIFCWFIREKGLIPDVLFDEKKIADMLDGFAPGKIRNKDSVFYRAILQNLFFATLNTEMDQRAWRRADQNFMAHSLYRHKECFRDPKAGLEWFKDIPFLNGGLFECLDRDFGEGKKPRYLRVDGFSDRGDSRPTVPDFLFFGPEREVDLSEEYGVKKFRNVRVRGLIDTLNRYKFTIEENTPFDQEVALDPELCGKVFENLLAAYNPETGTTARKATGSFYTPREIVDYMVDESLVAYLKGKIEPRMEANGRESGGPPSTAARSGRGGTRPSTDTESRLRALLAYDSETPDFTEAEIEALIDAIDHLKALDPAVGSGAFPMGILHRLVHVLGKLDPDNKRWKARQIAKLDDAVMREDAERIFRENYDDYGRKLYLIENCIYGVDIQPIAVQIAKMRFFISLIVDQKVNPKAPNLGVRALPNLETKFVAANTLIGIERPTQMMLRNPEIDNKEEELRKVREKHFTAKTLKAKAKCRDDDKTLRAEIADLLKNDGWDNTTAKQLAAWDPYDQNTSAPFFDSEWMFGITIGFDVAIGNPPYLEFKKLQQVFKDTYERRFETASGKYDIYVLFVERAHQLLKHGGTLTYIMPTMFLKKDYGRATRRFIAKALTPLRILDFADIPMFEGVTNYTGVFQFRAEPHRTTEMLRYHKYHRVDMLSRGESAVLEDILSNEADGHVKDIIDVPVSSLSDAPWDFHSHSTDGLLRKLEGKRLTLKDVTRAIFQGIASGKDEVFYVDDNIIEEYDLEKDLLHPLLKGRDVKRFHVAWSGTHVVYPYDAESHVLLEAILLRDYPNTYAYLKQCKPKLKGRGYFDRSTKLWYELWNQRKISNFLQQRIVTPEISNRNNFAVTATCFGNTKTYHILPRQESQQEYCVLLALLNSRLLEFYYQAITAPQAGGFYAYKTKFLERIPIPEIPKDVRKHLQSLTEQISRAKEADPTAGITDWEQEINERVSHLYGLTKEDLRIVEGATQG